MGRGRSGETETRGNGDVGEQEKVSVAPCGRRSLTSVGDKPRRYQKVWIGAA